MIKNFLAGVGMIGLVIGLVGCAFLFMFIGGLASNLNAAPVILEHGLATIDAAGPDSGARYIESAVSQPTSTPIIVEVVTTAVPLPTHTPLPTYTPVKLVDDRGLPPMGPYSLEEVGVCESVITSGDIDTLPSPQRELCQQYVK